VMTDSNKNGIPDETWFEIKGSGHNNAKKNYEISYHNTFGSINNITWDDSFGNSGQILKNNYHKQSWYPIQENEVLSFTGTLLSYDELYSNDCISSFSSLKYGYADNNHIINTCTDRSIPDNPYTDSVEACGGDPIDISWAIDKNGNKKEIESIDFIRIYTGVNFSDPILGEISTEISSIVDVKIKEEALPEIFIYPIPVSGKLNIEMNKFKDHKISIFDSKGIKIHEDNFFSNVYAIDISNFDKGLYIIKITEDDISYCRNFVKK